MNRINQFAFAGLASLCLAGVTGVAVAQVPPPPASRVPQPLPPPSTRVDSPDGMTTSFTTATSNFPESDPFVDPTNLLPTIYADVKASNGVPIPNTLPSSPQHPYNLLAKPPVVTSINPTSPADDLEAIYQSWKTNGHYDPHKFNPAALQRGIDILEGNPVPNRVYSGLPMLHYLGPLEVGKVVPEFDAQGKPIGGNVTVHQVWFDQHIEADTSFIDPSAMLQPGFGNLPWTITYVVDTLHRGHDDFSPMEMFFDDPNVTGKPKPLVMMDATFFPIQDGTRTVFVVKEPPARFFNLIYTWGWRDHPGRIDVMENALKSAMGKTLPQWEIDTFGANPRASESAKLAAIAMIGNLAPAKRMWNALRVLQQTGYDPVVMHEYERAFHQWQDRDKLPDGVKPDPNADITLFYVNNTIFGQAKGYHNSRFPHQPRLSKWHLRGTKVTIKLINDDYFPHAYVAVDFGGMRGWENTYQNTIPVGGDGPWFTFGRDYWEPITSSPTLVPAAVPAWSHGAGNAMQALTPARILAARTQNAPPQLARNLAIKRMVLGNEAPMFYSAASTNPYTRLFKPGYLDPDATTWDKTAHAANLSAPNGDTLGQHTVVLTLNFEPSLRLRLYQFDPLHHIQAIWSIH